MSPFYIVLSILGGIIYFSISAVWVRWAIINYTRRSGKNLTNGQEDMLAAIFFLWPVVVPQLWASFDGSAVGLEKYKQDQELIAAAKLDTEALLASDALADEINKLEKPKRRNTK